MQDINDTNEYDAKLLANLTALLEHFENKFEDIDPNTIEKFVQLNEFIDSPELNIEQLHNKINELLDLSEMYDLLRIERWPNGVICVYCGHEKTIRLSKFLNKNKYLCEKCHKEFFDDSETAIEPDRVKIAIMLHLLLADRNQEDVLKFLVSIYGFRKEYLEKLIPQLYSKTFLGDRSILKFLNFSHVDSLTITEFRKNLTHGIVRDAVIKHTSRNTSKSRTR
jgi:transposase-like protein